MGAHVCSPVFNRIDTVVFVGGVSFDKKKFPVFFLWCFAVLAGDAGSESAGSAQHESAHFKEGPHERGSVRYRS